MLRRMNALAGKEAEDFGRRLRQARTKAGLSLGKLAQKAGCTRQVLSKWENGGTARLDHLLLRRVCKALGVEERDLVKD